MWYEFGNFRLDATRRVLVSQPDGTPLSLTAKALETLTYLIERREAIVEKSALMSAIWPNVVVEENNLNQIISILRRTLGESPGENRFIVTYPGRGYRFVADVKAVTQPETDKPSSQPTNPALTVPKPARRTIGALIIAIAVLLVVIYLGAIRWRDSNLLREQRAMAFAEIADLLGKDKYGAAFALARPLMQDERMKTKELDELWRQIVVPMRPLVTESGATVYFKSYADVDSAWINAGVTPIQTEVDAPRGTLRIKIEKPGFRTGYFVIANPGLSVAGTPPGSIGAALPFEKIPLPLTAIGTLSDDMLLVPRTKLPESLAGWLSAHEISYEIPAFAIARCEVTNREFKEFIDAGGYDNQTYWQGLQFKEGGHALSWTDARKRFVDTTNRPGPAGWQLSTYPNRQDALPVGGISWYEAMAYARYRGQSLPTVHHWIRAAMVTSDGFFDNGPAIAMQSHFSAEAPAPAHDEIGLGPWGTTNMFGNMREWAWNSAGSYALALGGAWTDYASLYQAAYTSEPMHRLPQFGLRLMHTVNNATIDDELLQPIHLTYENPDNSSLKREPVSDDAFAAMRFQFTATHAKPISQNVEVIKETPLWIAEEVILKFAHDETTTLYIVRPKSHRAPLQPIVYGPPGDCCIFKRPNREILEQMNLVGFVVNSGRALVLPIWAGSYELKDTDAHDARSLADSRRRAALAWYRELSTTLDYLETRDDIDSPRVGFFGLSFGSYYIAPIALSMEGRIKAGVLASGGIAVVVPPHPMIDLVNYAPRITMPVLMLNGRYDHAFPYKESQQRLFNLLGTPANQKMHIVYDTGHVEFPPNSLARDTSNWFDKYLGPVR